MLTANQQQINQLVGKVSKGLGTWFNCSVTLGCPLGHTVYLRQVSKHRDPGQSQLRKSGQSAVDNTVEGDRSGEERGGKKPWIPAREGKRVGV